MFSKLRKTTAVLALCLVFSCGNKPSEGDAQKAISNVFGKLGKVEDVEKVNGWSGDNKNLYTMEVKYEIDLNEKVKRAIKSSKRDSFDNSMVQLILPICFKNGKLMDVCKGKAKLTFRKTEKGWTVINNKSKYVNNYF